MTVLRREERPISYQLYKYMNSNNNDDATKAVRIKMCFFTLSMREH